MAHEALIREWPALRGWLSEDRESLHLHRRLTEAAQEWQKLSKDSGELYRGTRLAQALEWAAQPGHANELNALEQEFLTASQGQAEGEEREREAQRQRELEAAQKLAETEHHSARRLRRRAWYLAGATGLAVMLMAAAGVIAVMANNSAHQATARQYSSAALVDLASDPGTGISEALQSIQEEPSVEAYSTLHQALFADHLRSRLNAHNGNIYGIAVNPDGTRLATIGTDRVLKVWRLNGMTIDPSPLLTVSDIGMNTEDYYSASAFFQDFLKFSPDGRYLVTVNNHSELILLDATSGQISGKLNIWDYSQSLRQGVQGIAVYPKESNLDEVEVAAFDGNTVWIVELGGGNDRLLDSNQVTDGYGLALAFRPDGTLITGGYDIQNNGEIDLWKIPSLEDPTQPPSSWEQTMLVERAGDPISFLNLSPDGNRIVYITHTDAYVVDLTPLASGNPVSQSLDIPLETVFDFFWDNVYFLADGERLVLVDHDGWINILDANNGHLLFSLAPTESTVNVAVAPMAQILYTGLVVGELCSWDVAAQGSPDWLAVPTGGVDADVVFNPDGISLYSWNITQTLPGQLEINRWQINGNSLAHLGNFTITTSPQYWDWITAFNPTRIAIAYLEYNDTKVGIYDISSGHLVNEFIYNGRISGLALNKDGSQVIVKTGTVSSAGQLGTIDIYDVASGQKLANYSVIPPNAGIYVAGFSLSTNSSLVLTYSLSWNDPVIYLRNTLSGKVIQTFTMPASAIGSVTLTADNRFMVACWEDNKLKTDGIYVMDVASGKLAHQIPLPSLCNALQISSDNRYLFASVSSSQTLVFDFNTGRELVALPGTSMAVNLLGTSIAGITPDDRYVMITARADHAAYGFVLDNNELVQLACQRLAAITLPEADGVVPQLPICATASE